MEWPSATAQPRNLNILKEREVSSFGTGRGGFATHPCAHSIKIETKKKRSRMSRANAFMGQIHGQSHNPSPASPQTHVYGMASRSTPRKSVRTRIPVSKAQRSSGAYFFCTSHYYWTIIRTTPGMPALTAHSIQLSGSGLLVGRRSWLLLSSRASLERHRPLRTQGP